MDDKPTAPKAPKAEVQPPPAAPAKKLTADALVRKHLEDTAKLKPDQHPETHQLVSEFMDAADLDSWQARALLARFHAHGLTRNSRIHPDVFKAALAEALAGRI